MGRVIHFEIHATEPEALIGFYRGLFDWTFTKWEGPMPYWMIKTGEPNSPGIDGGLLPRQGGRAAPGQAVNSYVCTVDVADLAASIAKGSSLGGTVVVPTMAIPGIGWLAYLTDPDGNIFGMMQMDEKAA
ncbi:MAG: VOC family protein [Betaproteobacteria bacterium]|nr:VOC family protein [Betaproteobacteria bacterium]